MNSYARYYRSLLSGEKRKPRGLPVTQRLNQTLVVRPCTTYRREHDNPAIGFIEGLQFVAGYFDIKQIEAVAPHAKLELFTSQSAYGPRLGKQLQWVVDELKNDYDSRRAVIVIADGKEPLAERPCTTSIQFHLTTGLHYAVLDMTVNMRSSDAVWGLPYDLIQFGLIHAVVCHCINLPLGQVTVNLGNAHVYETTKVPNKWETWEFSVPPFSRSVSEWQAIAVDLATHSMPFLYTSFSFQRSHD